MAPASKVNVALVGYGYWGPNLLRNYKGMPGTEVKWVCDSGSRALAKAQVQHPGIATTEEFDDVLDDPDVDAVLIATPISTHFALAKAALQAGKHVFVEKPMTSDPGHARELVALSAERHLVLMVGHTFVFSPPVRKVKELFDSGEMGDIYFITTSRVNLGLHQKDVSVVWDLAPHDLSILYYWLGQPARSVSVLGRNCADGRHPDVAFMNLRFPSGVIAEVQISWLSPVKLRRTMVVGSKKMLLYDDTESVEKVKIFDHGVQISAPEDFGEFQLSYRTGDIVSPKIEPREPLTIEAEAFLEAVRTGRTPISDARFGLEVVASLQAAETSMRGGGCEVEIDLEDDFVGVGDGCA